VNRTELKSLLGRLDGIGERLGETLDGAGPATIDLVGNLSTTTASLDRTLKNLDGLLGDVVFA
jgi:hypothetical protein